MRDGVLQMVTASTPNRVARHRQMGLEPARQWQAPQVVRCVNVTQLANGPNVRQHDGVTPECTRQAVGPNVRGSEPTIRQQPGQMFPWHGVQWRTALPETRTTPLQTSEWAPRSAARARGVHGRPRQASGLLCCDAGTPTGNDYRWIMLTP